MRKCPGCQLEKPLSEFYAHKGIRRCKPCIAEKAREWRKKNPERALYHTRRSYHKHKHKNRADPKWRERERKRVRDFTRMKKMGLSAARYEEMLAAQGGRCAICQSQTSFKGRPLYADHCHQTGRVRGLLCHKCNVAIAFMKDDPWLLRQAAAYLDANIPHRARNRALGVGEPRAAAVTRHQSARRAKRESANGSAPAMPDPAPLLPLSQPQ